MWLGHITAFESLIGGSARWFPLFALGVTEPLCGVGVVQLGCGYYYSLVLDDKGRVWGFGHNAQVILIRPFPPAILRPACNIYGV
jgi:hypothetical protein